MKFDDDVTIRVRHAQPYGPVLTDHVAVDGAARRDLALKYRSFVYYFRLFNFIIIIIICDDFSPALSSSNQRWVALEDDDRSVRTRTTK